jgi:hypothetical protein
MGPGFGEFEGGAVPNPLELPLGLFGSDDTGGEQRENASLDVQDHAAEHVAAGKNLRRQDDFEFDILEVHGRGDAAHQHGREHGGNDEKQQVVAGIQRGNTDDDSEDDVQDALSRDLVIEGVANATGGDTAGEIGHGGDSDDRGQDQRDRGEGHAEEHVAGFAEDGGEQRHAEREHEADERNHEANPGFAIDAGEDFFQSVAHKTGSRYEVRGTSCKRIWSCALYLVP